MAMSPDEVRTLRALMGRHKRAVEVVELSHRYHFGTRRASRRYAVHEYLVVGT